MANPARTSPEQGEYELRIGDVLDVKFFDSPSLNENVIVRPDGRISLQLIGDVDALGHTPESLRQHLVERYMGILRSPQIAVIVRQFTRGKVYVGGEVTKPGEISLAGTLTALQAVLMSGGFTHGAEERSVVILRNREGEPTRFMTVNLREQLDRVRYTDVTLEPSDIVYVPQTHIAQVAEFFDQYINRIIPIYRNLGFSFTYDITAEDFPSR